MCSCSLLYWNNKGTKFFSKVSEHNGFQGRLQKYQYLSISPYILNWELLYYFKIYWNNTAINVISGQDQNIFDFLEIWYADFQNSKASLPLYCLKERGGSMWAHKSRASSIFNQHLLVQVLAYGEHNNNSRMIPLETQLRRMDHSSYLFTNQHQDKFVNFLAWILCITDIMRIRLIVLLSFLRFHKLIVSFFVT